ncbi:hypothetical protein E2C01_062890 [Portunus trituberculatus]|uniref:Uncharacterized protein n=1 Tax=Portunus trituberculatus TaxID=210409 RepID=A0A5B7HFA1_PORTR|nr:hypothetical protein [Portunus trituberculatus]
MQHSNLPSHNTLFRKCAASVCLVLVSRAAPSERHANTSACNKEGRVVIQSIHITSRCNEQNCHAEGRPPGDLVVTIISSNHVKGGRLINITHHH